MFDKRKYINDFVKDNYKTVKLRIRKDDAVLIKKINSVDNINRYLLSLISEDINRNKEYHYINNDINIDIVLSKTMQKLVEEAERADYLEDYGLYMNIAYAIDSQGKKETANHIIRESEWKQLVRRYQL